MREQNEGTNKILTVAICAYNMEKYIERALKSCILDNNMERLEVLILNDGSTDGTALISKKYCENYPSTFILVNKENGGWGTNINKAVELATGKYFKILDADDWFETNTLSELLAILDKEDVDMVLTNHQEGTPDFMKINEHHWGKYHKKILRQEDIDVFLVLSIWDVAFKTKVVQEHHIELPSKMFYTDTMFSVQCMFGVKTIFFYDRVLYNYYFGRADQSVSIENQKKHYKEAVAVVQETVIRYIAKRQQYGESKLALERLTNTYIGEIFRRFVRISEDKNIPCKAVIKENDLMLKEQLPELYERASRAKIVRILRRTNYRGIMLLRVIAKLRGGI